MNSFSLTFLFIYVISIAISILIGIFVVRKGSRASEQIELLKMVVKNQNKILCQLSGEQYVEDKAEAKPPADWFDSPSEHT